MAATFLSALRGHSSPRLMPSACAISGDASFIGYLKIVLEEKSFFEEKEMTYVSLKLHVYISYHTKHHVHYE